MKVTTSIETMMLRLEYPIEKFEYNSLIVGNIFELGNSLINYITHDNTWYFSEQIREVI